MATIISRPKKDGSYSYRAQIIIKRKGKIIHREGETFSKKRDAQAWAKKREALLADKAVIEKLSGPAARTVKKLIEDYEEKVKPISEWGRSKQAVLDKWKERDEGQCLTSEVTSAWIIDYCIMRKKVEGAGASTIGHDLSHLRSVFAVAKELLGEPVSTIPFVEAMPVLKRLDLAARGGQRDRRPEVKELTAMMERAYKSDKSPRAIRTNAIPMSKIIVFQMFSGRRISETCRLKWSDLDRKKQSIIVRDMKDPGKKKGNDIRVYIPDEAWQVLLSMPQIEGEDRIFPYNDRSVETRFRTLRSKAGFEHKDPEDNLKLHDLRHECLSWLAEKNGLKGEHWDIPRIQSVSGHRGWGSLQRYVNLLEQKPVNKWAKWEWTKKVLS